MPAEKKFRPDPQQRPVARDGMKNRILALFGESNAISVRDIGRKINPVCCASMNASLSQLVLANQLQQFTDNGRKFYQRPPAKEGTTNV